jgi:hypothetical protein
MKLVSKNMRNRDVGMIIRIAEVEQLIGALSYHIHEKDEPSHALETKTTL